MYIYDSPYQTCLRANTHEEGMISNVAFMMCGASSKY
jgi:hypothetical protein